MKIHILHSGSSGNCYCVEIDHTVFLIDCGLSVNSIKKKLWERNYRLSDITACLVSHEHIDHIKAAQFLVDMGVDVYTSQGTIDAVGLKGHRVHAVSPVDVPVKIGSVFIRPFAVEHDAREPLAFLVISEITGERLLYITDTMFFQYQISGITHLMIEANYDPDIIAENAVSGRVNAARVKRTINNHMSIETALLTLERIDRSRLKEVWLLHLSNDNAADDFKRRVQELCGCEVYVA